MRTTDRGGEPAGRRVGRRRAGLVPAVAALLAAGCMPAAPPAAGPATGAVRAFDTGAGRFVSLEEAADALAEAEAVFVGEQHDDPETHRLELALLRALGARAEHVVVGLEMFERDAQPLLDAYLSGAATEARLLAEGRPWPNYATDYRPLVELARERGWPVVATNVPRPIAAAVAREGLDALDALPPSHRSLAAADPRCPRDAYHARFAAEMRRHPMGEAPPAEVDAMIERYFDAQCLKDATMAESIARALDAAPPGTVVVHFTGAFHSDRGLGTPARLRAIRPATRVRVLSIVPVDDPARVDPSAHRDLGDLVLFAARPGR